MGKILFKCTNKKVSFPTSWISEKLKGEQKRYTSPRLTLFAAIV